MKILLVVESDEREPLPDVAEEQQRFVATDAALARHPGQSDFSFFCRDLPSGPMAPDPKDSYLLALAEASEAEFLVAGDKELLSLKQHKSTRIITPAAMIEFLNKAESREKRKDK